MILCFPCFNTCMRVFSFKINLNVVSITSLHYIDMNFISARAKNQDKFIILKRRLFL